MAGRGPSPKEDRVRRAAPARGEWTTMQAVGWQHGKVPSPPPKLLKASRDAWATWMASWFAAHWTPDDLPALRQLIRLYDQVERDPGTASLHSQLRQMMDAYGITPKGQQDRRWRKPMDQAEAAPVEGEPAERRSRYSHLRAVAD